MSRKLLILGWDAADWKVIHPLLDQGLLPNLQALVERGSSGRLATLPPLVSPLLWTTIATGQTADRHGILGFTEPDPLSGGARPITSTSRRVKALWNILHQQGLRCHTVGWLATHPAEPLRGVCISDAFPTHTVPPDQPWPIPPGSVHPPELTPTLAEYRVHAGELRGEDLAPFVPRLAEIDQKHDRRLVSLAEELSRSITVHTLASWVLETQPWDFMAVYHDFIDHIGHEFMEFHPPRRPHVPERDFELYREVVTSAYRWMDLTLGTMLELAGEEATVLLVSDHGFHSDALRPLFAAETNGETLMQWHRSHGVFCLAGPGVKQDELVFGAGLLDVAPTVLTLFGIPAGNDMPGRVLTEALENTVVPERIPSWESVEGDAALHPPDFQSEDWATREALAQLADLGYIEVPSEDTTKAEQSAREQQKHALALVLHAQGRPAEALPLFEELRAANPEARSPRLHAIQCLRELGRREEARERLEALLREAPEGPFARTLMGNLQLEEGDVTGALEHFTAAESSEYPLPRLRLTIGYTYLKLDRLTEAEAVFRTVAEWDPDQIEAHEGLAEALLRQDRFEEAAAAALEATALDYSRGPAHYLLGFALSQSGRLTAARDALRIAARLLPEFPEVHEVLAQVLARTGDMPAALGHRSTAQRLRETAPRDLSSTGS